MGRELSDTARRTLRCSFVTSRSGVEEARPTPQSQGIAIAER